MRRLLLLATALTAACPKPAPTPDAAVEVDAGDERADAGAPTRDAGPSDAGLGPLPVERWCAMKGWLECQRDVRCQRLSPPAVTACLARKAAGCNQGAFERGVAAGRLQYLEGEARACLEATLTGSCLSPSPHCASVFTGLVPPDGGCVLPEECDSTGSCFQDGCPGVCVAWTRLGTACDSNRRRCAPAEGLCDVVDAGVFACVPLLGEDAGCRRYGACLPGLTCQDGTCIRSEAGPGEVCGATSGYPYCGAEYFCRRDLSQSPLPPGTCERRAGLGGTCTGNSDCLPSLRCTTVVTTGVCTHKSARTEPCAAYDDCEEGLYCSPSSATCAALPADGGDCGATGSSYRCALGQYCDFLFSGTTDVCQPKRGPDGDCSWSDMCTDGECRWGPLPDGGYGGRCILACAWRTDGGS